MNKEIILNCLKNNLQQFKEKYNIEQIGLFGSYARDEATKESDIDIFVKMPPKIFDMFAIKDLLENELGKKVDLIREHTHIKPLLLKRINRDIIYVKDIYEELYLHDPSDYTFNCFWQTPFPAKQKVTLIIRNYLGTMNKQDIHTLCKKFGKDRVLQELNNKYKELFEVGFVNIKGLEIPLRGDYKEYGTFKEILEIVNEFRTN